MSLFRKKRFIIPVILLFLFAVAAGVVYKEKHRVKKAIKKNAFLFEQTKLIGRWKRKLFGGDNLGEYEHYKTKIKTCLNPLKRLLREVQNKGNDAEWPVYQNRQKPSLTEKEAKEIESWRENMHQDIEELVPDYEIENVKPAYAST